MPKNVALFENEGSRLRELARDPNVLIIFTKHAQDRMRERSVSRIDIQSILKRCSVVKFEESRWEETWRAEGKDRDGRVLQVEVVPYERELEIKIITVITPMQR